MVEILNVCSALKYNRRVPQKHKRMAFFSKNRFLGVDFGTASIKMVELELRGGKPELVNYGEAILLAPDGGASVPIRSFKEDMMLRFRALLERMHPETNEMYVSMPSFLGLISLIDFPEMSESELEESVKFEAHKYIPSPLEDVALSWESLGTKDVPLPDGSGVQKKIEVLLVAALNKEVWQYEGYVHDAGYALKLLELETFSIARAMVGNDPGIFIVIDIGARAANLVLVEGGYVKMSRNIDAGGKDVTRTLSESLNISLDRAETLKRSNKDFLNSRETAVIFPAVEMIVSEATRMMEAWKAKRPDSRFDGVILSGGTAHMTGVSQYFSSRLGVPATLGDPWRNVVCPKALAPSIDRMGSSFSVALGLALYGVGAKKQS